MEATCTHAENGPRKQQTETVERAVQGHRRAARGLCERIVCQESRHHEEKRKGVLGAGAAREASNRARAGVGQRKAGGGVNTLVRRALWRLSAESKSPHHAAGDGR